MGMMDGMMDMMIKSISKEKREQMMIDMMPKMMEGIDMYEFMPRMMEHMLKDLTVDDVIQFLKLLAEDEEKLAEFGTKISEANLMRHMMFKTWESPLSFDETVEKVKDSAENNNWHVPEKRNLPKLWAEYDVPHAKRIEVLYFCNPHGGAAIAADDVFKAMTVMMPMGVSVYEKEDGTIEVSAMNLGMMADMFPTPAKEVLQSSGLNLENTMKVLSREE
jgi:uncharacterized protein (DUF302 family)